MTSTRFILNILLFAMIGIAESTYHVYNYDDGQGGEEHCCLVRVRDHFCLATPITRSLVQVDSHCRHKDANQQHGSDSKRDSSDYIDQIIRRLTIQKTHEVGEKVILELKEPLAKDLLIKDLVCLSSNTSSINLEQCYVEFASEEEPHKHQQHKRKRSHRHSNQQNASSADEGKDDDAAVEKDEQEKENEVEARRMQTSDPIHVREGRGLRLRLTHILQIENIRPRNRRQRQCVAWYIQQAKRARRNAWDNKKTCVPLNDHTERCLHQLLHRATQEKDQTETTLTIADQHSLGTRFLGSRLFCENHSGKNKLIGFHRRSQACFPNYKRIDIEHKFTDLVSLSDRKKNQAVLQFLVDNNKYKTEYEEDCHDKETLQEIIDHKEPPLADTEANDGKEDN